MSQPEGSFSLEDRASLSRLSHQEKALKRLILRNSASLRELNFSGSFLEGSIGNIILEQMGASCSIDGWEEHGDEPEISPDYDAPDLAISDVSESSLIELAPGVEKVLRSPKETWEAIRDGKTILTECFSCRAKLHCIEDAEFVVCPDCHVASPVEQSIGGVPLDCDGPEASFCNGIVLGVKEKDVVEWLEGGA
jgi:hypothetical protein